MQADVTVLGKGGDISKQHAHLLVAIAGNTITADCIEDAVIYVYNKYHEVVYSTHMRNNDGNIPLPLEGCIMFAGLTGDKVLIN